MKSMNLAGVGVMMAISAGAYARLPDADQNLQVKSLRGSYYGALSTAITNFNEVPAEDRLKSSASLRALTQVRHALKKLERAPGQLPLNSAMSDEELVKAMKGVRVADAFCNMPVVSYYIKAPGANLKIESHYSYYSAPTLDEVRALNPGCDVKPVYFSSSPAAMR